MALSLSEAQAMLERRNRCFMAADMDDYLAMWTEDCRVEVLLPAGSGEASSLLLDRTSLADIVGRAWAVEQVLLMETRSFGVGVSEGQEGEKGTSLLNEFSIVWQTRDGGARRLQTGMGAIEVAPDGRWRSLRDHYDAAGASMETARSSVAVAALLGT